MPRPTRESEAVGAMTRGSQNTARSASTALSAASSRALAPGSRETVTLDSEVETESTDRAWRAKTSKARARNPISCHIPSVSMEIRVMPLRDEIALTCGPATGPESEITVPGTSGRSVERTCSGMRCRCNGGIDRGWSTLAPMLAISCASS